MSTITELCSALVKFILAGVVVRIIWNAFSMMMEEDGKGALKQIRNLLVVAVLAGAVYALKDVILSYYL